MCNLILFILSLCLISSVHSKQSDKQIALEDEAKKKISIFATELKSALVTAIKNDGLHSAVKVCKQRAPEIAESLSTNGWAVARTSLKTRNESNLPDNWEQQVLINFDKQYKLGKKPNTLSTSVVNKNQFRYMKAIPTGQICLACHGDSVAPALLKSIEQQYPNDTATGFTLKDIRGAFTVTKTINSAL